MAEKDTGLAPANAHTMDTTIEKDMQSGTETAVPTPRRSLENEKTSVNKEIDSPDESIDEKNQVLEQIASADYPTSWRLVMIVVALVLVVILVALDMTIVSTAIPKITDQFRKVHA